MFLFKGLSDSLDHPRLMIYSHLLRNIRLDGHLEPPSQAIYSRKGGPRCSKKARAITIGLWVGQSRRAPHMATRCSVDIGTPICLVLGEPVGRSTRWDPIDDDDDRRRTDLTNRVSRFNSRHSSVRCIPGPFRDGLWTSRRWTESDSVLADQFVVERCGGGVGLLCAEWIRIVVSEARSSSDPTSTDSTVLCVACVQALHPVLGCPHRQSDVLALRIRSPRDSTARQRVLLLRELAECC